MLAPVFASKCLKQAFGNPFLTKLNSSLPTADAVFVAYLLH